MPELSPQMDPEWETKHYVARDGVVLVADVGGPESAPTVVLLHGGGQTRFSWASTMRSLVSVGYRVVNFDARGHGDSGWSQNGAYSFGVRAEDLRTVVAGVDGPVSLVGASMGGVTALAALGDGLRPAAAVLVDIVLRPERKGVERIRTFMTANPDGFADLNEAIEAVAAYNPHRPNPGDPRGLMRNLRKGADGRLRWHWDPRIVTDDLDSDLVIMARIIERLDPDTDVPILLIRGLNSDVVSDSNVEDFCRYLPKAEIYEVPGAGHMVAGDNNEVFARRVSGYLQLHMPLPSRRDQHGPNR
jgi:pimeloyl-ACP methyl ester carboxylesterase